MGGDNEEAIVERLWRSGSEEGKGDERSDGLCISGEAGGCRAAAVAAGAREDVESGLRGRSGVGVGAGVLV